MMMENLNYERTKLVKQTPKFAVNKEAIASSGFTLKECCEGLKAFHKYM